MFRFFFHGNPFSQAGKTIAWGSFVTGLLLIGFGLLVFVLRDIFAFIAAALFFMAGLSAIVYALKLYWAMYRVRRQNPYRHNVTIRDPFDL